MSIDVRFEPGSDHCGSVATIRIENAQDIFRFAVNMLNGQMEFCVAGRVLLVELREHLTPARFDPMARSLLGEDLHKRLSPYFERDKYCVVCEGEVKPGHGAVPIRNAKVLCEPCAEVTR